MAKWMAVLLAITKLGAKLCHIYKPVAFTKMASV